MPASRSRIERSIGSLLTADNLPYVEDMLRRFEADPASVDESWHLALHLLSDKAGVGADGACELERFRQAIRDAGHLFADVNPLAPRADVASKLEAIRALARLERAPPAAMALLPYYCGPLAVETGHIDSYDRREAIHQLVESYRLERPDWRRWIELIVRATGFERMMATKFTAKKRFGGEGAEGVALLVHRILQKLAESGVRKVVVGTMHRGRMSLMANVFGRPLDVMLAEFMGRHPFGDGRAADVPYHLGWQGRLRVADCEIEIDVLPNPSHLETVNAPALGKTRGYQDCEGRDRTAALILHTDGSVIAQGVVAEAIQLSETQGHNTAGTVHVVINNQISFTTEPHEARSSRTCTAAWKAVDSLIVRVNGDDVSAIVKAADLAVDYRSRTGSDSVVDFVCYRRNGHNEIDEPRFTQPLLYDRIAGRAPLVDALATQTSADLGVSAEAMAAMARSYRDEFDAAYARARVIVDEPPTMRPRRRDASGSRTPETGLARDRLVASIEAQSTLPAKGEYDRKVEKLVGDRRNALAHGVNWALAEALAFSALVEEGFHVRLSGQDVARGAFSHRHYRPVELRSGQARDLINSPGANRRLFEVVNSPLSEYAVLGFEFGYALARPNGLTIWEAQFGDFANGAQIIVDQFIAAAEEKWDLASPLVMLLPHGLDGQGPEHSSGRIERFLQLAEPDNFRVAIPTTPANYFHLLRQHVLSKATEPLVVFGAKALIRHPRAVSPLPDFGIEQTFRPVIASTASAANRLVFCCGKIAYDLEAGIAKRGLSDVSVVKLEQLWPFPEAEVAAFLASNLDASVVFVQEEPRNMGPMRALLPHIEQIMRRQGRASAAIGCVSREASGSPAGSFHVRHDADQSALVERALQPASQSHEQEG